MLLQERKINGIVELHALQKAEQMYEKYGIDKINKVKIHRGMKNCIRLRREYWRKFVSLIIDYT